MVRFVVNDSVRYRVLSIGVNESRVAEGRLRFARNDAIQMWQFLTSATVPGARPGDGRLLLDRDATVKTVTRALDSIVHDRPDYLIVYFAGHGSECGLALTDGVLSYRQLRDKLRRAQASRTLVIVDSCQSGTLVHMLEKGAGLGGIAGAPANLERDWAELVASANTGTRVISSTTPHQNAREGNVGSGGDFTLTFLTAATLAPGDLRGRGGYPFVSDECAFALARQLMIQRFGTTQLPERYGATTRLPLCVSQQEVKIGRAYIPLILPIDDGVSVHVEAQIIGRRHLATRLHCRFVSQFEVAWESDKWVTPTDDDWWLEEQTILQLDDYHTAVISSGYAFSSEWHVVLLDLYERVLAEMRLPVNCWAVA